MQTADRPRFRQDLVAEPIEDGGARFVDVADPDSGHMFRFFEVEYSLACAMDGERDVAGIVRWAEEELGLKPSQNEVRTVIATLGDLGYLESGAQAAAAVNAAAAAAAVEPASPRAGTPVRNAPDPVLERGVVAATSQRNAPSIDVELGTPGGRVAAKAAELPSAGDYELGAPGMAPAAKSKPARPAADDFALGASGAGGSTDLVADMAISPADVKEAVRASQVMKAVDVPPEVAAELEPQKPVEAKKPPTRPDPTPATRPAEATKPKPIDLPTERPVMPKAPTAPSSGISPLLIGLLVIVVLAAGGFLVYKYVIKKSDSKPTSQVTPVQPKPPEPPPPPVETAKLAIEQPAAEEIKPSGAATIATIVASDTTVKVGEPVARLVGYKPLETEVATLQKEIDKAKADLEKATKDRDAAQTAGNKAGVTTAENRVALATKTLGDREGKLATKTAALDKLLIKAPAAGKITAVAKANAKVTPTDIIATLTRDPLAVATFKSTGEVTANTRVLLGIKGSEQKLSCLVVATGGDGTKIACPKDAAPEGTEVIYAGVDPSAPPTGDKPAEVAPAGDKPAETPAETPATGSAQTPTEPPPVEKPIEKAVAPKRPAPRPRPQPKKPAAGSDAPAPATDKPAEPAPEPAAGSAS